VDDHNGNCREAPLANFQTLLKTIICKKSFRLLAADVATQDPAQLTAADATTIANGISTIMRGHVTPLNAVSEILTQYPVLRATSEQCAWFKPMLAAIVVRMMAVSVGKALRLAFSTSLSVFDVGSDLFTMLVYYLDFDFVTGSLIFWLGFPFYFFFFLLLPNLGFHCRFP
jgi:hypothetical protein